MSGCKDVLDRLLAGETDYAALRPDPASDMVPVGAYQPAQPD